jgi:rubrerythrin
VRNLLTLGKDFPPSRRVNLPDLSPDHYQTVCSLEPQDQEALLRMAAELQMTRDELRQKCRELNLIQSRDYRELALENDDLSQRNGKQAATLERQAERIQQLEAALVEAQAAQQDAEERPAVVTCPECGYIFAV